jgi:hypothetical protein
MRTGCCCKLSKVLRRVLVSGANGSSLLWAIGALVLLSVVGATVALMSPSALQSKLEQEAGMRAYYNANAGLNYILGAQQASIASGNSFSNYKIVMGNEGSVEYVLANNDKFSFKLGNFISSGSGGTYQIVNLVGTSGRQSSGSAAYGYILYGGAKGDSSIITYGTQSNTADFANSIAESNYTTNLQGTVTGDLVSKGYTFNGGVNVKGSLTYTATNTPIKISGGTIGGTGKYVCSNSDVIFSGGVTINADVYVHGNMTIDSGSAQINGNVYSSGYAKEENGYITGNVNSQKSITIQNWGGKGKLFSGDDDGYGNIYVQGSWPTWTGDVSSLHNVYVTGTIKGDAHLKGSVIGSTVTGKIDSNTTNPIAPVACNKTKVFSPPLISATNSYNLTGSDTLYAGTSGNYNTYKYKAFTTGGGTSLCLDLSAGGGLNILVSGDVKMNGNLYIKTSSKGSCVKFDSATVSYSSYASKVLLVSDGSVTFNGGSNWFGSIWAKGDVTLGGGSIVIGGVYSSDGDINAASAGGVTMTYVASECLLNNCIYSNL